MSLFVSESIPWKFLLQIHSLPPGADSHSSIKKELKTTENISSRRKWNLSQFRWEGPDKLWFSIANRVGWAANWLTFIIGEDFDIFKEVFKVSRVVKLRPVLDIIFPDTFFRTQFNLFKRRGPHRYFLKTIKWPLMSENQHFTRDFYFS